MSYTLAGFVIVVLFVVVIGVINEKFVHMPNDIAIVLFTFVICAIFKLLVSLGVVPKDNVFTEKFALFSFNGFLMDGILCFMLFAGSSKVHFSRFIKNIRAIGLLALLTTVLSSFLYGALFYLLSLALNLGLDFFSCVLLGCIVSPTDPIAATSILNKCGLSKNVTSVIEGESLFNDGTGVALFVCVKNIVGQTSSESFLVVMAKELIGAIAVGLAVSFLMTRLLRLTKDPGKHVLISLLAVSLCYVSCEYLEFSGVVASVVCGMFFSVSMDNIKRWREVVDPKDYYADFWEIADMLLNSALFVLIGFSIFYIPSHKYLLILILDAVILNLISRFTGVGVSGFIVGKKSLPNRYNLTEFVSLMTWSGLKGGLSMALALSTEELLPPDIYHIVLIVTFATMFFTTVIQGLTVSKVFEKIERHKRERLTTKPLNIETDKTQEAST